MIERATVRVRCALCALLLSACVAPGPAPAEPDPEDPGSKSGELPDPEAFYDFDFINYTPQSFTVHVDSLGVSLLATATLGRSDQYNCLAANNQTALLQSYQGLVRLHAMWADDIGALDPRFEICSMGSTDFGDPRGVDIFDYLRTVECTNRRIERIFFHDGAHYDYAGEGPTLLDLITPDVATVDMDGPPGFPNGRHPADQITDLFFAAGFLRFDDGMTADQLNMNARWNDVDFPAEFPYLAPAHAVAPGGYYDPENPDAERCEDTCAWSGDGECDDGGPGAAYAVCTYGTDCGDCGPRS